MDFKFSSLLTVPYFILISRRSGIKKWGGGLHEKVLMYIKGMGSDWITNYISIVVLVAISECSFNFILPGIVLSTFPILSLTVMVLLGNSYSHYRNKVTEA